MALQILPSVRLIFACDDAVVDLADDKWTLKNPWAVVQLPLGVGFPFRHKALCVYAQFTEGVGSFKLAAELCQVMGDGSRRWVGRSASTEMVFPGGHQLYVFDMGFQIRRAPFRSPGIYEFRIVTDEQVLSGMTATIRVLGRE